MTATGKKGKTGVETGNMHYDRTRRFNSPDGSGLTEREQEAVIAEIESIQDMGQKRQAICAVTDSVLRRKLINANIGLFNRNEEPAEKERENLTVITTMKDGTQVIQHLTAEQSDEIRRREIVEIKDKDKRRQAIRENIDLFEHRR